MAHMGHILTKLYIKPYELVTKSILDVGFSFSIGPLSYNDNFTTFIKFALVVYINIYNFSAIYRYGPHGAHSYD